MKLLILVCFLAILPQFSSGKNYYLVNDEKSASKYVYGLFGLTNVVGKWIFYITLQAVFDFVKLWHKSFFLEKLCFSTLGLTKTSSEQNLFFIVAAAGEHTTKKSQFCEIEKYDLKCFSLMKILKSCSPNRTMNSEFRLNDQKRTKKFAISCQIW